MSKVTDLLQANRDAFALLTDPLTLRYYVASGSPDDYNDSDTVEHDDSPATADGVISLSEDTVESRPSGVERETPANIHVEDSAFVTEGGEPWPGSSLPNTDVEYMEIVDADGTAFRVVSELNCGGGFVEIEGRTVG